jgi:hypothetical protein
MSIDTSAVAERRTLRFQSLDHVVADAERLVQAPRVQMLGNWPLDHLLMHLATAINLSVEGNSFRAPWFVRLIGPWIKKRMLSKGLRAGFRMPREAEAVFYHKADSNSAALEALRQAVARVASQPMASSHPVFGKLTHEEWTQLHLRHSELHLSFALPLDG